MHAITIVVDDDAPEYLRCTVIKGYGDGIIIGVFALLIDAMMWTILYETNTTID